MRRWLWATVVGALLVSVVVGLGGMGAADAAPPRAASGADPAATAETLVTKYFTLLQDKDEAGLDRFMSPAF